MVKVSICIPTYNTGDKLNRCINSLLNQSMNKDEFEIIIVDDCSNDSLTINILNDFKNKYPYLIKVYFLKTNTGNASKPRNVALSHVTGEYTFFVDSDDYLHTDALNDMYTFAKSNHSDVVIGKYGVEGKGRGVPIAAFENGNIPDANIIKNSVIYTLSVLKLFRTHVIKKNNISFSTSSITGEDQLFTIDFIMNCQKISILSDKEYYVVCNDFSNGSHLSTKKSNPKSFFETISKIYKSIYNSTIYVNDIEFLHEVAGKYTTRMMRHGQNKNFSMSNLSYEEKINWLKYWSKTLNNHLPREADYFVTDIFTLKLEAIRSNNLFNVMLSDNLLSKK